MKRKLGEERKKEVFCPDEEKAETCCPVILR